MAEEKKHRELREHFTGKLYTDEHVWLAEVDHLL